MFIFKRGGFCCELNYLFYWLLDRLGYRVALLTCRPYQVKREQYSEWFSHMALQVSMNESQFIVDVGFAQNYRAPLKFLPNQIQSDVTGHYKIVSALPSSPPPTTTTSQQQQQQQQVPPTSSSTSFSSSFSSSTTSTSSSSSSSNTNSSNANTLIISSHSQQPVQTTFVIQKSLNEELTQWMPLYEFNIKPKRIEEFKSMVEFVKSREHLRFHQRLLVFFLLLLKSYTIFELELKIESC